jgi:phenylacetate-CoA ligase
MTSYFDANETRSTAEREAVLMQGLREQVACVKEKSVAYAALFAQVIPASLVNREALAKLPVTRKSDLKARQSALPPFGGFTTKKPHDMAKLFQSPGPLYEPEGRVPNFWRSARAMYAAGFRAGDIVHNSFSYHLTPAGSMMESGALALGCTVIPAGVGQTELQLQAIADLRPNCYAGTPSFLRILIEKATETGVDISSLKCAMVSGEALPPTLRAWFAERGIAVTQMFGTADLGLIAYETRSANGSLNPGMVLDEDLLLEIVYPGTGEPVPEGEVGEMVLTTLNPDYPLIRFATGDMSAVMTEPSPCGRTNVRIKGWLGRADQTTKVRGMFVHPSQVLDVMKRHREITHLRLVVTGEMANDSMTLHCELGNGAQPAPEAVGDSVRDITKLRAEVAFVAAGSLPRDGKLIEDARSYK